MTDSADEGRPASPGALEELDEELARLKRFLPDEGQVGEEDAEEIREQFETVAGALQKLLAEVGNPHREIDTRSGKRITPLDPDPAKIHLDDIAHGLSNVGRFAGQGKEFYSVARHSVHVSHEVEARGGSAEAQRYALVHDAAEAYLSDVPGPVKKSLPGYKHAERRVDAAVVEALGIDVTADEREAVEDADGEIGKYELTVQFPGRGHEEADLAHDPGDLDEGMDAKRLFQRRARELGGLGA